MFGRADQQDQQNKMIMCYRSKEKAETVFNTELVNFDSDANADEMVMAAVLVQCTPQMHENRARAIGYGKQCSAMQNSV